MNRINRLIKKALFRIFRIITFRKGIYGKIGKCNKFMKNVLINEGCKIGNYNYFGTNVIITSTIIGNYCSIAPNVIIGPGDHMLTNISTCVRVMDTAGFHVDLERGECIIGNDVWIGSNVVVLRGVKVGDGAVLAAGAIVNKDVPPYSVVGGVPAKVIKYRFDKETIEKIKASTWWSMDLNEAAKRVKLQQIEHLMSRNQENKNENIYQES